MRFPVIQPAFYRCADPWCIHRINTVEIKTYVQIINPRGNLLKRFFHDTVYAEPVNLFHREHLHAEPDQILPLAPVDIAESDDGDILRIEFLEGTADITQRSRTKTGKNRKRHTVDIARRRTFR